jgi:hypothetical protein
MHWAELYAFTALDAFRIIYSRCLESSLLQGAGRTDPNRRAGVALRTAVQIDFQFLFSLIYSTLILMEQIKHFQSPLFPQHHSEN